MKRVNVKSVTPLDLVVGDRVLDHGAILEVVRVEDSKFHANKADRVVACTCHLIGEPGSIPRSWFDTPTSLVTRGAQWAESLEDGLYWRVQGNSKAKFSKILSNASKEAITPSHSA